MSKTEKVIFLVDVKNIARRGEVQEVGAAFAKNFLLPKQKALVYSKAIDKQLQQQGAKLREQEALRRNKEEEIFINLNQQKLTFLLREKNGKTFGSVSAFDISRVLGEKFGIQISRRDLLNFRPLQGRGVFPVEVRINKYLTAKLQITVESRQESVKTQ